MIVPTTGRHTPIRSDRNRIDPVDGSGWFVASALLVPLQRPEGQVAQRFHHSLWRVIWGAHNRSLPR